MFDEFELLEEVNLRCNECGKEVKTVVYKGFDTSDFVCQRCSYGDLGGEDEDSDI